jgi:hypothetical protein
MLNILLHIFRKKHLTPAHFKRAIEIDVTDVTPPPAPPPFTCPTCNQDTLPFATPPDEPQVYYCLACKQIYKQEK